MIYEPQQKNVRPLNILIFALLLFGAVTYAVPIIASTYEVNVPPFPFTITTVLCIVAAVYLAVRYLMTSFKYIIRPRDDSLADCGFVPEYASNVSANIASLDFVVTKSQGTRADVMECVLSLGDLSATYELTRGGLTKNDVRKKYAQDGFVYFDYTVTFARESALELVFSDGGHPVGIIIEPDERMRGYLTALAGKNE